MLARFTLSIIAPKYGEDGSSVKMIKRILEKLRRCLTLPWTFCMSHSSNFSMEISNKLWKKSNLKQETIYSKIWLNSLLIYIYIYIYITWFKKHSFHLIYFTWKLYFTFHWWKFLEWTKQSNPEIVNLI